MAADVEPWIRGPHDLFVLVLTKSIITIHYTMEKTLSYKLGKKYFICVKL